MSQFLQTQTNKTLEKLYPEQYIPLDPTQREEFYNSLPVKELQNVKKITTFDLGCGYNKLVVNDELRPANKKPRDSLQMLCSNIMAEFMTNEKSVKQQPKAESAEQNQQSQAENNKDSEQNKSNQQTKTSEILPENSDDNKPSVTQMYHSYKKSLAQHTLPPIGVSIVCFDNPQSLNTFAVYNAFDLVGLISTVFETRMKYIFKQRFPVTIDIVKANSDEMNQEKIQQQFHQAQNEPEKQNKVQVNEQILRFMNVPDSKIRYNEEQKRDLNEKFCNANLKIKQFLLIGLQKYANEKQSQLQSGFYFVKDKNDKDSLTEYFLNPEYVESDISEEEKLPTGWVVVHNPESIDFQKNLFENENFQIIFGILDECKMLVDNQMESIFKETFGDLAKGW